MKSGLGKRIMSAVLLLSLSLIAVPVPAHAAYDPFGGVQCSGEVSASAVCGSKGSGDNPLTGGHGILGAATNIISFIAGVACVILIIVSGIRYITSAGSSENITSARRTLQYALIGLAIIVISRILIFVVVSKL